MLLRLCDVSKSYREGALEVRAVRNVSMEIARERFTMIVGPSGSGKTTLLNLIGAIDKPSAGLIQIEGQDLRAMSDRALTRFRAQKIGFIFQSFNLMPVLSAYENVEYALLLTQASLRDRKERTLEALGAVGLLPQKNQRPNQLSGGQRQRVAIARALVKKPSIVLADEPTANLDSETGRTIIQLMREMQERLKTTFIFSTHDPELMKHAEETFIIRDGSLTKAGRVKRRPLAA
jgi:putative ABC transport system ATP-binding protein